MTDISPIIGGIAKLKPIPAVVNKIMSPVQDPDKGVAELAEVISCDAMVTANLLKVANSAYFGRSGRFDSVKQAIVFLAMDEVVDLVLLSTAGENLRRSHKGYGLEAGALWRYSAASALMARDLAVKKGTVDKHLIFAAALLKDIGKVVLEQYVTDQFEVIQRLVAEGSLSFREAEKAVLGIDHAELGAMTARIWQFSDEMIDIIRHHHQPEKSVLKAPETAVVHLSDVLCMMMGIGGGVDGLAYHFHRDTIRGLDMTETDLQMMIAEFAVSLKHVEALIGMP